MRNAAIVSAFVLLLPVAIAAQCADDSGCSSDQWCRNGQCIPFAKEGQRCGGYTRTPDMCAPGLRCAASVNVPDIPGVCCRPCTQQSDCRADQYCSATQLCLAPTGCVTDGDCDVPSNHWKHEACAGHSFCGTNHCMWVCDTPTPADSPALRKPITYVHVQKDYNVSVNAVASHGVAAEVAHRDRHVVKVHFLESDGEAVLNVCPDAACTVGCMVAASVTGKQHLLAVTAQQGLACHFHMVNRDVFYIDPQLTHDEDCTSRETCARLRPSTPTIRPVVIHIGANVPVTVRPEAGASNRSFTITESHVAHRRIALTAKMAARSDVLVADVCTSSTCESKCTVRVAASALATHGMADIMSQQGGLSCALHLVNQDVYFLDAKMAEATNDDSAIRRQCGPQVCGIDELCIRTYVSGGACMSCEMGCPEGRRCAGGCCVPEHETYSYACVKSPDTCAGLLSCEGGCGESLCGGVPCGCERIESAFRVTCHVCAP